ncbi:SpoIIE family protein phosphatase [Streptacidiphilus griseoplanus]|uniref:SpoIIE family protein phosphatase n=1 Tax=Peterkaempfera griseoplana TaxID=66896 RepID=UPI0006E406A2|nr:SpoIIE family protein phosphatase [Peterkaempfera griseoplana]
MDLPDLNNVLVESLRTAVRALDADAVLAYLFDEDGEVLRLTVADGTPPVIFIMPERIAVTAPYPTAVAARNGEIAVAGPGSSETIRAPEAAPIPYLVASAALGYEGHCLGALTAVWAPTPSSAAPSDRNRTQLRAIADDLSVTLAALAKAGVPMTPGRSPVIAPVLRPARPAIDGAGGGAAADGWGLPDVPGSSAVTFMYHIHQLAAALNEAADITDVMEVVQQRVMKPFGAESFLVTSVKYDRVWVAGYSDCPQEAVKRLHGSSVHLVSPFTAVLGARAPLLFPDQAALLSAYPVSRGFPRIEENAAGGWVYVPIGVGSRSTGAFALGFRRPLHLGAEEQAVLTMMVRLLGPTLVRARASQAEQSIAENVLKTLLPEAAWDLPGLAAVARYVPACASGMGGDWYDVITRSPAKAALVVGDVEGHSIDSSVVMAQLRTAVRSYLMEGHPPASALARANRMLTLLAPGVLATCCVVDVDIDDGTLEIASAGHPPPVLRYPDGSVATPDVPPGLPFGVDPDACYARTEVSVPPRSVLMLYTNGLSVSSVDEHGAESLLTSLGPSAVTRPERLLDLVLRTCLEAPARRDDVAVLIAEYQGVQGGGLRHTDSMNIGRHDLHGVGEVRTFVRERLHEWGLEEQADALELMSSEVVTNALVHADSDVDFRLRHYDDRVRVDVRDADPTPPVPEPVVLANQPGSESEHGRGLVIVDVLASDWGNTPSGRGKTIWFEQTVAV